MKEDGDSYQDDRAFRPGGALALYLQAPEEGFPANNSPHIRQDPEHS